MVRFRNDFNEDRVAPMLGYTLVIVGQVIPVPDEEWEHWDAGGWTALDPRPEPVPEPEAAPADPAPAAASPAAKTAKPTATAATPEGTDSA